MVIGVVAFDIFSVRNKNKALWQSLEMQKTETQSKIKSLEDAATFKEKDYKSKLENANNQVENAKRKAKEERDEFFNEIRTLKDAHRKELDELRASFEKKMQEMREDLNEQRNRLKEESLSRRVVVQANRQEFQKDVNESQPQKSTKKIKCRKCSGKGELEVKKRCEHCGGSGKIKEVRTRWVGGDWYRYGREKNSTIFHDCPHCLPGPMQGGGSKGYTIEKETCPKCDGKGVVESD